MPYAALSQQVVKECERLGFHRVGIISALAAPRYADYERWVDDGHAGQMHYLTRPKERAARRDVREILPSARSVVVVALSHAAPDTDDTAASPRGHIARYARGRDYHSVLKTKLWSLAKFISEAAGHDVEAKPCVDTAPVLERDFAERARLGFVAKNTMLIAPGLGSYVMLGELLLDVELTPTQTAPITQGCGECTACLDACPTGAFVSAYRLDSRRCISYLTIELDGTIPIELRPLIGAHVFGCDICQQVCPFNAAAAAPHKPRGAPELAPIDTAHSTPDLIDMLSLGAAQYRRFVGGTALRRARREQFLRNVCVALGNSDDARAVAPLRGALADRHALVRAHAAWALGQFGDEDGLQSRLRVEDDAAVRDEIALALTACSRARAT